MKKIGLCLSLLLFISLHSSAQASWLDNNFGTHGVYNQDSMVINSICVQPDNKVLLGGTSYRSFYMMRLHENGLIDDSFGKNGHLFVPYDIVAPGSQWAQILFLAQQSDGKILALGSFGYFSAGFDAIATGVVLSRHFANGSVDSSFGANGILNLDFDGRFYSPNVFLDYKLFLDSSKNLTIARIYSAREYYPTTILPAAIRLDSTGKVDSTFGYNGRIFVPVTLSPYILSVIMQPDGKILLGGADSSLYNLSLVRYTYTGKIDTGFGINGISKIKSDTLEYDWISSLYVQSDGKILSTVLADYSPVMNFRLNRYLSNGNIDSSFAGNGCVRTYFPFTQSHTNSLAIVARQYANGKVLVAGVTNSDSTRPVQVFCYARYLVDGIIDSSFGENGLLIASPTISDQYITGLKIRSDDKFIVSGPYKVFRYLSSPNVGIIDFALDNNSVYIYPNPMRGSETLSYTLKTAESITITLQDMEGRLIKTFTENEKQDAGEHKQLIAMPDDLTAGSYIFSIASQTGHVGIKVVK